MVEVQVVAARRVVVSLALCGLEIHSLQRGGAGTTASATLQVYIAYMCVLSLAILSLLCLAVHALHQPGSCDLDQRCRQGAPPCQRGRRAVHCTDGQVRSFCTCVIVSVCLTAVLCAAADSDRCTRPRCWRFPAAPPHSPAQCSAVLWTH